MKYLTPYGSGQLFISLAAMILGVHLVVLSSIETLPSSYLVFGSIVVFSGLIILIMNLRYHLVNLGN